MLAAPPHQFVGARLRTRFQFHERAGRFAPFVVRLGHDGSGGDRGMLIERVFHLDRGNILAA